LAVVPACGDRPHATPTGASREKMLAGDGKRARARFRLPSSQRSDGSLPPGFLYVHNVLEVRYVLSEPRTGPIGSGEPK
jgi:hypothetical protein